MNGIDDLCYLWGATLRVEHLRRKHVYRCGWDHGKWRWLTDAPSHAVAVGAVVTCFTYYLQHETGGTSFDRAARDHMLVNLDALMSHEYMPRNDRELTEVAVIFEAWRAKHYDAPAITLVKQLEKESS